MEKLKFSKIGIYVIYGVFAFSLLGFFRSCNTNKNIKKQTKEIIELKNSVDSLTAKLDEFYNKEELDTRMEIEGLRTSKRTLYDWNAVIRTTVRPDDRMNEYDEQIKKLEKKIK